MKATGIGGAPRWRTKKSPPNQNLPCMMLKTRFSFVCKYQPWYKTLINDKRRINKFSNDILSTQRETWSNWKRIRDKRWVSFSIGTSQLKGTRMTQQWRIKKRELAIYSITIEVQCLGGSFAFAWQKKSPAQKFWQKIVIQKNRSKNLYDPVKTPLISSIYFYNHLPPLPAY